MTLDAITVEHVKGWFASQQPLRHRQGGEPNQDPQGRRALPDRLQDIRGRQIQPTNLHRRGLRRPQIALCPRISEARSARGPARATPCQDRTPLLSTPRAALHPCAHSLLGARSPRLRLLATQFDGPMQSANTSHIQTDTSTVRHLPRWSKLWLFSKPSTAPTRPQAS